MKSLLLAIAAAAALSAMTHVQAIDLGDFVSHDKKPDAEARKVVR